MIRSFVGMLSTISAAIRRPAALLLVTAGLLAACAHAPDIPRTDRASGLDLAPIAARFRVPHCEVSVPISQDEAMRHTQRWYSINLAEHSDWIALVQATQPGDQLRKVLCHKEGGAGNVFFGLFRDGTLVAETHYVILD